MRQPRINHSRAEVCAFAASMQLRPSLISSPGCPRCGGTRHCFGSNVAMLAQMHPVPPRLALGARLIHDLASSGTSLKVSRPRARPHFGGAIVYDGSSAGLACQWLLIELPHDEYERRGLE